ncbi:hypothetical protein ACH5RR_038144 [Cinchona calisaya]|uniref:C2H2-type domain-containing protein n=1 Tax=Cinchona calisaya TaxID=153742 RepID=A0ABD2YCY8_9GENT
MEDDDIEHQISDSIKKGSPPDDKSRNLGDHGIELKNQEEKKELLEKDLAKDQKQLPTLQSNKNTTRTCEECGSEFESAQGLGGHMRIHSKSNKDLIKSSQQKKPFVELKKKKQEVAADFSKKMDHLLQIKSSSSNDSPDVHAPICSICGVGFTSIQALSGHMRVHPKSDQPPSSAVNASSLLYSVSGAEPQRVDLAKSLDGWTVTAKRSDRKDKRMLQAADTLMKLARGEATTTSDSLTNYKTENEEIMTTKKGGKKQFSVDHPVKQLRIEERKFDDGKNYSKDVQETDFLAGKSGKEDEATHDDLLIKRLKNSGQSTKGSIVINAQSTKGKIGGKSIKNSIDESTSDQSTKGSIVINAQSTKGKIGGKSIKNSIDESTSDQSTKGSIVINAQSTKGKIGGKSIQNSIDESTSDQSTKGSIVINAQSTKDKIGGKSIQNSIDESTSAAADDCKKSDEGPPDISDQSKICNRNSPNTSQALAGQVAQGPSSQVTSAGEVSHSGGGRVGIDLNELPLLGDQEDDAVTESDDHAAGCDCASCSYKSKLNR